MSKKQSKVKTLFMKLLKYTSALIIIGCLTTTAMLQAREDIRSIHHRQHLRYQGQEFRQEVPGLAKGYVPLQEKTQDIGKEIFGFHPYWEGTAWQGYNYDLLSTIAWFGLDITSSGNISNDNGWPVTSLINKAHQNGVEVVVVAILFDDDSIERLLNNASYRQNLIDNLVNEVKSAGADGVNIDFESMPDGVKSEFVTFMNDLTSAFHTEIPGSQVTVDMPAIDWSNRFNFKGLANACDGLMIMGYDYHWKGSGTTGPVAPLKGTSYNVSGTVETYLSQTDFNREKLILGLPWYGYEWPAAGPEPGASTTGNGRARFYSDAEALAATYGKRRYSAGGEIPWYRHEENGGWTQGWYDDSLSLSLKYQYALSEDLKGIGIWALGYDDGDPKMWGALRDHFIEDTIPPVRPAGFHVEAVRATSVRVGVHSQNDAVRYRVYSSRDGLNFTQIKESVDPATTVALPLDTLTYLRMTATNSAGESPPTDVLGVVPGSGTRVLVVNGFDRLSGTTNTRDFIRQHGSAIWSNGVRFDAASNEAIASGDVDLNDYYAVDWILGEEGTSTSAFSPDEQTLVKTYLESGGNLFVSGSEIGYDLSENGSSEDKEFYQSYLKATYVSDAAGSPHSFYPDGAPVFQGIGTIQFDDGTHGTYDVDYPDGIHPVGEASIALKYENSDYDTQGGAGIVYSGSFGESDTPGSLVYLSPGFETIYPAQTRTLFMEKVLKYFEMTTSIQAPHSREVPEQFQLVGAYPNPFNGRVNIQYTIPAHLNDPVSISIYDITGKRVASLTNEIRNAGKGEVQWNGQNDAGKEVSSGTYLVVAGNGRMRQSIRITFIK